MTADLGLTKDVAEVGEGEGEPRSKGLLRHRLADVPDIMCRRN